MTDEPLYIEDDRYSRFRLIAWWDQEKIAAARILVVGAGALGNEVLKNLALLGVGHIFLVDFDSIENTNLTRSVLFRERDCLKDKVDVAAVALRDINADCHVYPMKTNVMTGVGLGLFRDVDVVIGCLDNREARLWVNRCCWKTSTPWVDGGIQEINGVAKVFVPPDGACYECAMTENDYRLINLRYSCPLLKQEDIAAGKVPTAPTISSIIAGLQTQEALKLIHGMPVSDGAAMVFNGVANQFYSTQYQHREDCLSHETYPEPVVTGLSALDHTAEELFSVSAPLLDGDSMTLSLDRDLVVSLECSTCARDQKILRPAQEVGVSEAKCPGCGEIMKPRLEHQIVQNSSLSLEKLSDLGIPPYDIVRVSTNQKEVYLLLSGDQERVYQTPSSR